VNGSVGGRSAGVRMAPKVIEEMNNLHARSQELAGNVPILGGRRARRELRDARQAERDLLRVLGFDSYEEFASTAPETPPLPTVEATSPRSAADVVVVSSHDDELWSRLAACEEELAQARHAISLLRDDLRAARLRDPADGLADARAAVFQTCAELNRACDELVRERQVLTEVRAAAEAEARATIAAAAEAARRIIDDAQQCAVNAVRDAAVTLEGARRLTELREAPATD
jgi:uncharacterized protein YhaN